MSLGSSLGKRCKNRRKSGSSLRRSLVLPENQAARKLRKLVWASLLAERLASGRPTSLCERPQPTPTASHSATASTCAGAGDKAPRPSAEVESRKVLGAFG